MGDCRYCGRKAGFLRGKHKECESTYQAGRQQMVNLVADAAGQSNFSEVALLDDLSSVAKESCIDDDGIRAVIAEGWHQAVREGLADGILTQDEEARLRDFRDQFFGVFRRAGKNEKFLGLPIRETASFAEVMAGLHDNKPTLDDPHPTASIFSSVTIIFFSSSISSRRCAAFSNSRARAASFIWNSRSLMTRYISSRDISSRATW